MKTKHMHRRFGLMLMIVLIAFSAAAQQPQNSNQLNTPAQLTAANFTYKVFQAPNKMYGYDIFKNEKIVFHQPAAFVTPQNVLGAIAKKEQAEKAALRSIEKLKKGKPATLTSEEIKNILSI